MADGVLVLAHGSRGELGKGEVERVLQRLTVGLKALLDKQVEIIGATLQFNHPSLEEAVAVLFARGVRRIVIAPYFLFPGRHITEHIPQIIESLQHTYPGIRFLLANNLGLDKSFINLVARRIKEKAPELAPHISINSVSLIEQESMKIVEELLAFPPTLSEDEVKITKRIVHACGDIEIAPLIRFSQSAVSSGLSAIARGSPIFSDVRMVTAGINEHLAQFFGCSLFCALDEVEVGGITTGESITRTAAGIAHLGERLDGAVVAIGNAPTALFALLNLIDNRKVKPSLVVGMPVGFVQASESKQELMKRDIHYITVTGTRGGSPLASAAVNALLRIARDKYECHALSEGEAKGRC